MDLLKTILGDDLFNQVQEKINAHNGDEANKENQLKLANLAKGGYVSKDKHTALETEKGNLASQLTEAQNLIAELKKSNKADETLQSKVTEYEGKITALENELQQTKSENAINTAIRDAKGVDADYLAYKIKEKAKEKGIELTLDDTGKVKGLDDIITELKTAIPTQFDTSKGGNGGNLKVDPVPLPNGNGNNTLTKAELLKKPYPERVAFQNENPEQYNEIMKS